MTDPILTRTFWCRACMAEGCPCGAAVVYHLGVEEIGEIVAGVEPFHCPCCGCDERHRLTTMDDHPAYLKLPKDVRRELFGTTLCEIGGRDVEVTALAESIEGAVRRFSEELALNPKIAEVLVRLHGTAQIFETLLDDLAQKVGEVVGSVGPTVADLEVEVPLP